MTENKKPIWKKYFLSLFIVLLLIISVIWGYAEKRSTASTFEEQITEIKIAHDEEIEVLEGEHLKQLLSTLALAVRSEMISENMFQVNQYFLQYLNTANVKRLLVVDPNTGIVLLSTNKKDEGLTYDKEELVKSKKAITKVYENSTYAATPVMGLNTQIGVLIMQVD